MTNLKNIVEEFRDNYKERREDVNEVETLENELYSISGIDKNSQHAIVLMPFDSEHFDNFGSVCGHVGNKVFSNREIQKFLSEYAHGKWALGIIDEPDLDDTYKNQTIPLSSVALPLIESDGRVFEYLTNREGGSFRCGSSKVDGWTIYESE